MTSGRLSGTGDQAVAGDATPSAEVFATLSTGPQSISLEIVVQSESWVQTTWCEPKAFQRLLKAATNELAPDATERSGFTLVLSSDAEIAELNARFRDIAKPTNVLSFPATAPTGPAMMEVPDEDHADGEVRYLGDVIVAHETVNREAERDGKSFDDHLQHLVLHGLLHLFGDDHEDDDSADAMEAKEVRILRQIGIPDPYHPSPPKER